MSAAYLVTTYAPRDNHGRTYRFADAREAVRVFEGLAAHKARRRVAQPGEEWAVIVDPATGAVRKRYVLRNGRVERMQ
jgi:hypothetical protein